MAPNLGFVEPTIALHYVFESPKDKIVYDVSHQSYTHKILTGRAEAFLNPEKYHSVTGYTEPCESEHDHFMIGHTSTSVSLALGLATARDVKFDTDYSKLNTYKVDKRGNKVALVGLGNYYALAESAAAELAKQGIDATIINPRYATGIDEEFYDKVPYGELMERNRLTPTQVAEDVMAALK